MVEPSYVHSDVSWLSCQLEGGSLETSDLEEEESVLFLGHLLVDMARLARGAPSSKEHLPERSFRNTYRFELGLACRRELLHLLQQLLFLPQPVA